MHGASGAVVVVVAVVVEVVVVPAVVCWPTSVSISLYNRLEDEDDPTTGLTRRGLLAFVCGFIFLVTGWVVVSTYPKDKMWRMKPATALAGRGLLIS